jgi:hypothetical protein
MASMVESSISILLFTQQQIDDPAAADVRAGAAAMVEDIRIAAPGFFERVGENRHQVAALVVNRLGEFRNSGVVPGEPIGIDGGRTEGITEGVGESRDDETISVSWLPRVGRGI